MYRFGAALLDLEQLWKLIAHGNWYLMRPETLHELAGYTPGVAFPCAVLADAQTGRITMCYGRANTVTEM